VEGPRGLRGPPRDGLAGGPRVSKPVSKIYLKRKTRGVLAKFSFFRLLQQPVMPMISIHIFARGKRPRTRTTGANTNKES